MTRDTIIGITAVTLYIVWLIVFLLIVERWLRWLTEWVFGITIVRQFDRPVGKVKLLDVFFVFGWKVDGPAGFGLRLAVGLLRFVFWMMAVTIPFLMGVAAYVIINR